MVQNFKPLYNDTSQTHYWQQLSLVENVESDSQEKLLLMGAESDPARHFRVSKSPGLIGLTGLRSFNFIEIHMQINELLPTFAFDT